MLVLQKGRTNWQFLCCNYDFHYEVLSLPSRCSRDNTLDFLYLPSFQQRFSLVAFRFTENYDDVYLHCQVTVCRSTDTESRCAKGCLRDTYRKRREVSDEMAQTLYVGPITLVKGHNAGK